MANKLIKLFNFNFPTIIKGYAIYINLKLLQLLYNYVRSDIYYAHVICHPV